MCIDKMKKNNYWNFMFSMFFMSTGFDGSIILNPRDQKIIFWKQCLRQDYLAENIIQSWWKTFLNWKVGKTLRRTAIRDSLDVPVWWKMPYQKDILMNDSKQRFSKGFLCIVFFLDILGDLSLNRECYKNKQFVNFWWF